MRVKIAHLLYSLNPGGAASVTRRLIPELQTNNVDSEIIVTAQSLAINSNIHNAPVLNCHIQGTGFLWIRPYVLGQWLRRSYAWSFWLRLTIILKKRKIQILHSNVHGTLCLSQLWSARLAKIPYVLRMGSPSSTYQSTFRGSFLFCKSLRECDQVLGVSPSVYQAYPSFFSKLKTNATYFGSGIANGLEDPGPRNVLLGQRMRNQMHIPDDAFVVGFTGRLIESKRVKDLVTAFSLLQANTKQLHLLVVGDGPCKDKLLQQVRSIGLESKTHFVGSQADTLSFLQMMDIFAFPTEFEAFPNSLLEAMALGIPIVASNVYGNKDLITHESTGLLYSCGDVKALSLSLERILNHPEFSIKIGLSAREIFLHHYTLKICAQKWIECWRHSLISK